MSLLNLGLNLVGSFLARKGGRTATAQDFGRRSFAEGATVLLTSSGEDPPVVNPRVATLLQRKFAPPPIPKAAPVSLLTDIFRTGGGGTIGGAFGSLFPSIGVATGSAIGGAIGRTFMSPRSGSSVGMVQPAAGVIPAMGALPGLARLGGLAGTAVAAGVIGVRTVARSAAMYCRRHPAWCSQIGGVAAIAAMIGDGTLPPIKRRRARGITASEFKGFRKVHRTLSGFCAPKMRIRRKRS